MKKFSVFMLIAFSFCACHTVVQSDFPDFEKFPVVNSIFTNGEPLIIQLSYTQKLDTLPVATINDALVELLLPNGSCEILESTGEGMYNSKAILEEGNPYTCKITVPGYEPIVCRDSLPRKPEIVKIEHINNAGIDTEGILHPAIRVTFKNNPLLGQYFEVLYETKSGNYIVITSIHSVTDPVLLSEGLEMALFSNENLPDSSYTLHLNYSTIWSSRGFNGNEPLHYKLFPVIVELRQVSFHYYQFIKMQYFYNNGREVSGPGGTMTASPIYSNSPSGYGIFAGYSSVLSDTIFPQGYDQ